MKLDLFSGLVPVSHVSELLRDKHYLGPTKSARFAYLDEHGAAVFSAPRSRRLPADWLELTRWCLHGAPNAGSKQWARIVPHLHALGVSTVVSYSDPEQGHTGALYRACNWSWAPTWHRLRPPPSGNGNWSDKPQAVKDRWVFLLAPDPSREAALAVQDRAVLRKMPWASYREPIWRNGRYRPSEAGGEFHRFKVEEAA